MFKLSQKEIMENWGDNTEPLVSVGCITYNHEDYIEEAIQSFLMQKTNFPFEVIIHDDASTDDTAKIIKRYAKKYPNIIKPIFQIENQYSQINGPIYPRFVYPKCNGEYIALCEGDDYWTDPFKLQKQVDILEKHSGCSWSFHPAQIVNHIKPTGKICRITNNNKVFGEQDIFKINKTRFSPTASILFRTRHIKQLPNWVLNAPVGDLPLKLYLTTKGKAYYINEAMSAYRINVAVSWNSDYKSNLNKRKKLHLGLIKMLHSFNIYTKYKYYEQIINKQIEYLFKIVKYYPLKLRLKYLFLIINNTKVLNIVKINTIIRILILTLLPQSSKLLIRIKEITTAITHEWRSYANT